MESYDEEWIVFKQIVYGEGFLKLDINVCMKQFVVNVLFFFMVFGFKMVWQFGEMGYDVLIEEGGWIGRKFLYWEYLDNEVWKGLCNIYVKLLKLRWEYFEFFNLGSMFFWLVKIVNWIGGCFLIFVVINGKRLVVVGNFIVKLIEVIIFFLVMGVWINYLDGMKFYVILILIGLMIFVYECCVYINF